MEANTDEFKLNQPIDGEDAYLSGMDEDSVLVPMEKMVDRKGKISFGLNTLKTFGLLFEYPVPVELSLIKYCFMGCKYAFHGDTEIWIRRNGIVELARLKYLATEVGEQELPGVEFLSCDDDGRSCWVKADGITCFPMTSARHWLRVTTRGGHEVMWTNDHDCEVWTHEGWKRKKAHELRVGDCLPFLHRIHESAANEWLVSTKDLDIDADALQELPVSVMNSNQCYEVIDKVLARLFAGTGKYYSDTHSWIFKSESKTLVDQVQFLLARRGVASSRDNYGDTLKVAGEDCKRLVFLIGAVHLSEAEPQWSSSLRMTPNQMLDGHDGRWLAQSNPAGLYAPSLSPKPVECNPSKFAVKMRDSDAWCSPIVCIERVEAESVDELAYCPLQDTTERVVTSDLLVSLRCFATANKRANDAVQGSVDNPIETVIRKIAKAKGQGYDPTSFVEYCIREGYAIHFSNNVDPFLPASEKKYKLGQRMLEACEDYEVPLNILTKEVYPNEQVRKLLINNPELFGVYCTITCDTDEESRKWETGAPPTSERLRRLKDLSDNGVHVTVAINPYVPEWIKNPREFLKRIAWAGAKCVFMEPLHFSQRQKAVVSPEMAAVPHNRFDEWHSEDKFHWKIWCEEAGLKFHTAVDWPDTCTNAVSNRFPHFPIKFGELADECLEASEGGKYAVQVGWKQVEDYFGRHSVWNHVFKVEEIMRAFVFTSEGHRIVNHALGTRNTMKNIVKHIWNSPGVYSNMVAMSHFIPLVSSKDAEEDDHDGYYWFEDEQGNQLYAFYPDAFFARKIERHWDVDDETMPELVEIEFDIVNE